MFLFVNAFGAFWFEIFIKFDQQKFYNFRAAKVKTAKKYLFST